VARCLALDRLDVLVIDLGPRDERLVPYRRLDKEL
jgi:hypothetical protein